LQQQEDKGKISLHYYDESGFSTTSCIPYAWQIRGQTKELPKQRSKRLNTLGFLSRANEAFFHTVEGSVKTEHVIAAFDEFTENYYREYQQTKIPCIAVLDNASIHRSKEFIKHVEHWESRAVFLHYLPAYSPELNLIEILWRKVKYEWLELTAYKNYEQLKKAVLHILENIGNKYAITFT
jgi:transposase